MKTPMTLKALLDNFLITKQPFKIGDTVIVNKQLYVLVKGSPSCAGCDFYTDERMICPLWDIVNSNKKYNELNCKILLSCNKFVNIKEGL